MSEVSVTYEFQTIIIIINNPKLNMTPKQVTHVRICQRLLLIAQQPQKTSMFVIKMTNPEKLEKIVRQILVVF